MTSVTAAILLVMCTSSLAGQTQPSSPPPASPQENNPASTPQNKSASAPSVDASKMGVSLSRIQRELKNAEVREDRRDNPLSLEFHVEVYGTAPKIDLLKDYPLIGPVPYGAPTHQEVIDFLTPEEFRSPMIPFSSLAVWAAQKLMNRSKKQRCEAELAEYKQLVMQGVNVAAPRCTQ
jgi:hypothetical protein